MVKHGDQYNDAFYAAQRSGSQEAATAVVPAIVARYSPKSVVDVGCGVGVWLQAFAAHGVEDYLGIDGPFVDPSQRHIAVERFYAHDLREPLDIPRRFDVATCLEVAEHLDEGHARTLVQTLTGLANRVVFSAAIPFQGGTSHINEKWPSWWAALFQECGYHPDTQLRDELWATQTQDPWYIQNLVTFAADNKPFAGALDVVHPATYLRLSDPDSLALRKVAAVTVRAVGRRVSKRLAR